VINRITLLLTVSLLTLMSALAGAQTLNDEIRARLAPAGAVCVFGDECAAGMAVPGRSGGPRAAEEIYQTYCMACHATGVSEAPVLGNAEMWAPRIEKGIEVLYQNSINGINVMPPRGTCVDCSDDEMRAAVDYMVEQLQ
jgi:cytochrome c5